MQLIPIYTGLYNDQSDKLDATIGLSDVKIKPHEYLTVDIDSCNLKLKLSDYDQLILTGP